MTGIAAGRSRVHVALLESSNGKKEGVVLWKGGARIVHDRVRKDGKVVRRTYEARALPLVWTPDVEVRVWVRGPEEVVQS